jgi:hypothetical protein
MFNWLFTKSEKISEVAEDSDNDLIIIDNDFGEHKTNFSKVLEEIPIYFWKCKFYDTLRELERVMFFTRYPYKETIFDPNLPLIICWLQLRKKEEHRLKLIRYYRYVLIGLIVFDIIVLLF